MKLQLTPRFTDLANLVVAKGANFALTALIFGIVARGADAHAFADFGYWWSIAVMVGGLLLGGLSSALIRVTAVEGSLAHLARPLARVLLGLALLALLWWGALRLVPRFSSTVLLLGGVFAFGVVLQLQTAVLSLLRAAEATRANVMASVAIVATVPLAFRAISGGRTAPVELFLALALAFALGTVVASAVAWRALAPVITGPRRSAATSGVFLSSVASFTAVNVFSYAAVNVDFTLFKLMGGQEEFAAVAGCKIFFERFVLPALLVFAGAISLSVLRHPARSDDPEASRPRLELVLHRRFVGGVLAIFVGMVGAYQVFAAVRGQAERLPIGWTACVAAGYLAYVLNAILMDVLVVRRGVRAVVAHVALFLTTGGALQAAAIHLFRIGGWACAWLAFNVVVLLILAREGLSVRLVRSLGGTWGSQPTGAP